MKIERLYSTRTSTGPLFCPACCHKLGRMESPSIGYLAQCGGCKRAIVVRDVEGGGMAVIFTDDRRGDHRAQVALEA